MGHEFVGEVTALGSAYTNPTASTRPGLYGSLKVGDHVVSPFSTSCGECQYVEGERPTRQDSGRLKQCNVQILQSGIHVPMRALSAIWLAITPWRASSVCACPTRGWDTLPCPHSRGRRGVRCIVAFARGYTTNRVLCCSPGPESCQHPPIP